jgi:hypothetical protein
MLSHCKRCAPLVLLLLGGCSLCTGDMTFDEDLVASFKEYAEEPLKSIRQTKTRGTCSPMIDPATQDSVCQTPPGSGPKPQYNIRRVCPTAHDPQAKCPPSENIKPIVHIITAPDCGGCEKMKGAVNRGTAARELLKEFDVVHLHGPVQDWSIRWKEVDHESYVPQTYFYSRSGRPLNIINSEFDPDFTHDPQL